VTEPEFLFYELPSPCWIFERNTLCVRAANGAATEIFGLTEEQFQAKTILDLLVDEGNPLYNSAEALSSLQSSRGKYAAAFRTGNNERIVAEVTYNCITYRGEECRLEVIHLLPEQTNAIFPENRPDAGRELRESQQRYKSLFANSPYAIVRFDANGRVNAVNSAAEQMTGYSSQQMHGRHYRHIVSRSSRQLARQYFSEAMLGYGGSWDIQIRHHSGHTVSVSGVNMPAVVDGVVVGWYAILRDMSEQNRLTALIRGENEVLSLIADRHPLDHVLHVIARTVGHQTGDVLCAILLCTENSNRLRFAAAPGLSVDFREAVESLEIGPETGACGKALATLQRVITTDVRTDPLWEGYVSLSIRNGIYACCATPIISSQQRALGTFVIYYDEPREPVEWETRLIDRACNLARIAIERSASEQQLAIVQRALESVTAGIVITDSRQKGNPVVYVNKAFEEITGYSPEEVIGSPCHLLEAGATHDDGFDLIQQSLSAERDCMVVVPNLRKDGSEFWNALTLSPVRNAHKKLTHWIAVMSDVTNRKRINEVIRDSEERFRQLIENASDIVSIIEPDGLIRYQSPSVERVLGWTPDEMVGKNLSEFVHPDDVDELRRLVGELLNSPGASTAVEVRYYHSEGHWRSIEQVATNLTGQPGVRGILMNARDVTERREQQLKLDFLAHHDPLTNLPNRSVFDDRLHAAIAVALRTGTKLAVLFLDLDRFKNINDTLGHRVGDQLLVTVAHRLTSAIRDFDLVARWGGDEFTLLLPKISSTNDAIRASQRIIAALSAPIKSFDHEFYITGTIGISIYPNSGTDAETLVRNADTAMYRAKQGGKNYFQVYTADMNTGAVERLTLETEMRKALERGEFVLNYQPQLDLRNGRITGVEALVRWQHPHRGLIPPSDFIALAEDTGLIVPLGEWVLNEACRQAAQFNRSGASPIRVAVNLSARQIGRKDFVKTVERALRSSGLPPNLLELELTESVLMNDEQSSIKPLLDLRAMEVDLSVDDFGTGYSSFMYLKRYPVTSLKIDRSFISNIGADGDDATIVRSMIDMAHNLRLRVVAEGVETAAQHSFLCKHDCDEIQGYYFSAPIPAEALTVLLAGFHTDPANALTISD
jgi:diguanylate cyclase (GGDEF)-like protein/PAS domain S-box-containing protein